MPKKAEKTWILVADGARARFLAQHEPKGALEPVLEEEDALSRLPTRDLGADKPGRTQARIGDGSRHAMAPPADWHDFEKHVFAKEIAKILDRAAHAHAFDRLVLVAPPKTLGELRTELGKAALGKVTAEIGKDLTGVSSHDLPGHLAEALSPHRP